MLIICDVVMAQRRTRNINNPDYDIRRKFTYGFSIGLHSSSYQLKHSDLFGTGLDSLSSIQPPRTAGFSLGFIVNLNVAELLDLRVLPRVSFFEYHMNYNFIDGTTLQTFVESTMVELPIMAKFKSERRGNFRMYVAGGVAPGFEASGKNDLEDPDNGLNVRDLNLSLELAVGIDIYYPLFKFSPEIRYSRGLTNMIKGDNDFSAGIERLNTHNIHFFLLFQ